jgi:hypothetical protein
VPTAAHSRTSIFFLAILSFSFNPPTYKNGSVTGLSVEILPRDNNYKISLLKLREGFMLVTRYRPDSSGFKSRWGATNFSLHICPDRPWGPLTLLYDGYLGYLPAVKRPELPLNAHAHLSPRYRLDRAISILSVCTFLSISVYFLY